MRSTHTARAIAAALLDMTSGGRTHGYAIAKQTSLKSGTVAPTLDRFAAAGWISDEWETTATPAGRPRRRYWRIVDRDALTAYARR